LFFNGQMNPKGLSEAKHSHLLVFEPSAILLNNQFLMCLSLIMNVSFMEFIESITIDY